MEAFKDSNVPVLILSNQADEIVFNQLSHYKKFQFTNIESSYEEMEKDLGDKSKKQIDSNIPSLPEEDVASFSLWLKNEFYQNVGKVTVSKRLTKAPAVLFGQMSASMRMVMQMMDQNPTAMNDANRNNTLEINP